MKTNIVLLTVTSLLGASMWGCDGGSSKKVEIGLDGEDFLNDESREYSMALGTIASSKDDDSIRWSAQVLVKGSNGESAQTKQERVSLAKISEEAGRIKIRLGDEIDIKVTAERVTPEGAQVLATNIQSVAERSETTLVLWNAQCKDLGSSSFKIDLNSLRSGKFTLGSDGKSVQVSMRLCDFENLLVAPVISIEPQPAMQLHNVVFRCEGVNGTSQLVDISKPSCRYGYRPEADGNAASNVVPAGTDVTKEFKPEISVDFSNTHGRQQYSLYMYFSDLSQLPAFATKANGCDRMEVVMYEFEKPEKEHRLHFKNGGNGWVALNDLGSRPKLSNPSTLEFFLHCHWRGEVRPGNTISIPFVK